MPLNRLLDISSRSLMAYQQALNVTSHNIANVQNENYSRQKVTFAAEPSEGYVGGYFGSGVKIEDVARVKNSIIENNIRQNNYSNAYANKQSELLSSVESFFTEPGDTGLSTLMNNFFNSWTELASNPTSSSLRTNVVTAAAKMADKFSGVSAGLDQTKIDLRSEATAMVANINSLSKQINVLNKQISDRKTTNSDANDLLDLRDGLIIDLSKLANISVATDDKGATSVSIGGVFAADTSFANEFEVQESGGKIFVTAKGESQPLALTGGELGAVTDTFNKNLTDIKTNLDLLASTIYDNVNSLHQAGYTGHDTPFTGIKFFESVSGSDLKINSNILTDNRFIAVSGTGISGNNDTAKAIAALDSKKLIDGYTLADNYGNLISGVANSIDASTQNASSYKLALDQLSEQKNAYSGVSIDEEMTNIISFQRSYNASAKLIKIADDMIQTVLNMV